MATALAFARFGATLLEGLSNPLWLGFIFAWLFSVVLGSALCVARHADHVAEIVGEPYGTLILTLSVTTIEVMSITAVMLHGVAQSHRALIVGHRALGERRARRDRGEDKEGRGMGGESLSVHEGFSRQGTLTRAFYRRGSRGIESECVIGT